ncbi:MAG: hypothetical protein HOD58_11870 [Gammaproteobacteria bacterium]|jgi:hypothetical protein|nr:hypothetical protein [Gammaproteobacteria bacterium]MBT4330614.1 hypothetical protein [Gammaproteobacteria bacterium]MBT4812534.1 hypothetical protein [Thiotrichales bacterium]
MQNLHQWVGDFSTLPIPITEGVLADDFSQWQKCRPAISKEVVIYHPIRGS